ncbi:MAG: hypothetical protein ACOZAO_03890 [Patescibacteria group bacterium]
MNFKFLIDEKLLFFVCLTKGNKTESWVDLQNELWDKYRLGYKLLQGKMLGFFVSSKEDSLSKATAEVDALFKEGLTSHVFSTILKNTQEYKQWLENEWKHNKTKVLTELEDILKIPLPNQEHEVFVISRKSNAGRNIGGNKILFGHSEDWKNYSIAYLVHEALYSVFGKSDLEHALIELATDNELRIRLNDGEKYFKVGELEVGHKYLRELEKEILPEWRKHLEGKNSVNELIKKLKSTQITQA